MRIQLDPPRGREEVSHGAHNPKAWLSISHPRYFYHNNDTIHEATKIMEASNIVIRCNILMFLSRRKLC